MMLAALPVKTMVYVLTMSMATPAIAVAGIRMLTAVMKVSTLMIYQIECWYIRYYEV